MNHKLLLSATLLILIKLSAFGQPANNSGVSNMPVSLNSEEADQKDMHRSSNSAHLGSWKLLSQKITGENGEVVTTDSTVTFQRRILTKSRFVAIQEKRMLEDENRKVVTAVAGGRYLLSNGICEEFTEYSTAEGLHTPKIKYKLTVTNDQLHIIGTFGTSGSGVYEEIYTRDGI